MTSRMNWLDEQAALERLFPHVTITNLMHLIWQNRPDLQMAFDLQTEKGQQGFCAWFHVSAQNEYGINPTENQQPSNIKSANEQIQFAPTAYSRLVSYERLLRSAGRYLPSSWRIAGKKLWYRGLSHMAQALARNNSASSPILSATNVSTTTDDNVEGPAGANLIGYAKAELGMGEHVRMSATALATTDAHWGVFNFGDGAPTPSRQQAPVDGIELLDTNHYRANIFHINADQMFVAFCRLGRTFFENRYNIGYWAWELPHCPTSWRPLLRFVDEIWAPSRFIQTAFAEVASVPVTFMPLCVELPQFQRCDRAQFGLPSNTYLFLFTFDFLSYIERKNPYAAIRAFQKAFPINRADVGLVIKVMNADESSPAWRRMLEIIDNDPRVFVLNKTMDRITVLQLFAACNAFVSLHRSEGFGRGPAEAMYLGKPVIVTNWSGNTDFTLPDNACLVDYTLQPVRADEYVFAEGQHWANPDEEHAAWYMRRLLDEHTWGQAIGNAASAHIRENYSPQRIGNLYTDRLKTLGLV